MDKHGDFVKQHEDPMSPPRKDISAELAHRKAVAEKMARMIPVGRTGTPDDIGYAVTFLASDEAAWITGQTIAVNGGSTTS